ncbi:hypothetical protein, partial [Pantoea dispersa]
RARAKRRGGDLGRVRASGADGAVTLADVKQAAADGSAKAGAVVGAASAATLRSPAVAAEAAPAAARPPQAAPARTPLSAAGKPMRTQPPGVAVQGQPEPLKGVRRNLARVLAEAQRQVVRTTVLDDA